MAVGVRRLSAMLGLMRVVHNSSSTTCRIVMKPSGLLNFHIGTCILSGNCFWAKVVEMTAVWLRCFTANLWSDALSATPRWLVRLLWNSVEYYITMEMCAFCQKFMYKVNLKSYYVIVLSKGLSLSPIKMCPIWIVCPHWSPNVKNSTGCGVISPVSGDVYLLLLSGRFRA